MRNIRRLAILIFHPGEGEPELPGVGQDCQNTQNFMLSPRGGGWRPDEMIVLWKPTNQEVWNVVQAADTDYLFVYYSGHGAGQVTAVWENGVCRLIDERLLALGSGGFIQDLALINDNVSRQMIVCDCCRVRPPARIGGIEEVLEQIPYTARDVEVARHWFDLFVEQSPTGCTIVHSAADGKPSWDTREGGVFTVALLQRALEWRPEYQFSGLSVEEIVSYLRDKLGKREKPQLPEIVYKTGDLKVPLVLNTPWPSRAPARVRPVYSRERTEFMDVQFAASPSPQVKGLLALGGIALGLVLLSEWE